MSDLKINVSKIEKESPVTILHLTGHLHGDTEGHLMETARQQHQEGAKYLLLDLSGVEILTSAGLRAIHNIFNLFTPAEDKILMRQHNEEPYKSPYFKLVCPNPNVYYILNISGFLQNIYLFSKMDDAVGSF